MTEEYGDIYRLNYGYRPDGTLKSRNVFHNIDYFATTGMSASYVYDNLERLIYDEGYITHGRFEYYYFYDGNKKTVKLCFLLMITIMKNTWI